MKTLNIFFFGLFFSIVGVGTTLSQNIHQHQQWQDLLETYVNTQGDVDYKNLKQNEKKLDAYLDLISKNPPKDSWTKNKKKAYLINAYNAFAVKLILDHYPIESIKNIGGFFSSPFTTEFAKIGGKLYSLDDIEKGMLLEMGDPRVHFAVNCASESCPKLLNEAYVAEKLEKQLDASAKTFVNSDKNKLSKTKVELSKIFKWYASDFESEFGSVIRFINIYADETIDEEAFINFLSYSWELNEN
ncbi:DUF547 domain-containing protein [Psychroflexus sp. MES1-P1E]|uniref:DUF547 domain-containing protein n=1 Tax=Psychroflexus sp. MES1-P1E TaxID=2058320 RepID=UPI000C7D82CE|nr:DUF547 domain-containing protein [Psychroflexus sp. MES1-P1E]PKG42009.1 DUF547 domain-containing protein [Psychroflexus sp. MES1-P1E]